MRQRTLAIIKPNVTNRRVMGKIITIIEEAGFDIKEANIETLTREEAGGFYEEHRGKPFYEELIRFSTSGPVFLMLLEAENAVEEFRKLMGATDPEKAAPGTIRKLFGESTTANAVHGSDSLSAAQREITYFFGAA